MSTLDINLSSREPENGNILSGSVFTPTFGEYECPGIGIEISFRGYGTLDGGVESPPILVENRDGVPYVIIWGDANSEEPTHVISLEGAKNANCKDT